MNSPNSSRLFTTYYMPTQNVTLPQWMESMTEFDGTFDGTIDEGVYINEQEYLEDHTFLNLTNGKMI
jgi:hypothetical protein